MCFTAEKSEGAGKFSSYLPGCQQIQAPLVGDCGWYLTGLGALGLQISERRSNHGEQRAPLVFDDTVERSLSLILFTTKDKESQ